MIYDKELIDDIYFRLYGDKESINKEEDILNYYKNNDNFIRILNNEEIDYLYKNISKTNLNENYIVYNLLNIGLLIKNDLGYYEVPEYIFPDVVSGINKAYNQINCSFNDQIKDFAIIYVGLVRIFGAINVYLIDTYFEHYVTNKPENLKVNFEVYKHPYFNRFVKLFNYRKQSFFVPNEFKAKSDLSFTRYQRDVVIEERYNYIHVHDIGTKFICTNNLFYPIIRQNIKLSYMLSTCNRNDLVLYSGCNNYELNLVFDKEMLKTLNFAEINLLENYMMCMPSYVPVVGHTLHCDPFIYKKVIKYSTKFYNFASEYYNIDLNKGAESLENLYKKMVSEDFKVAKEYLTYEKASSEDEQLFKEALTKAKYRLYEIYEETNYGLLVTTPLSYNFIACKLPLENATKTGRLKYLKAKMVIFNFKDNVIILNSDFVSPMTEEEIINIKKRFKKGKISYSVD